MNNRIDVKIAIIGNSGAGKETFCKMLFLDAANKIRLNPLSKLSEIYMEIDPENFKNSTKNIIKECADQNNLIMRQTQIANLDELRKNIDPFFYRYSRRIQGLVNSNEMGINRNVLLTFYFIANNYKNFTKEIEMANIIIYLIDATDEFNPSNELFGYLVNTVKNSSGTKFLIPILNKSDLISQCNTTTTIKEIIEKNNLQKCLASPILMSAKYAAIFRMVNYRSSANVDADTLECIAQQYGIDTKNFARDVCKNFDRYCEKCGYNDFRMTFMKILSQNYIVMIDENISNDIHHLASCITNVGEFNTLFNSIQHRTDKMNKIFKKNYQELILEAIKIVLYKMSTVEKPNDKIIEYIQEYYGNIMEIDVLIKTSREKIRDKMIDDIINTHDKLKMTSFMPSQVSVAFEKIIALFPSKNQIERVVRHICEMYGTNIKNILEINDDTMAPMLYATYFTERETMAMLSMLNEIKSMIDYDEYKIYLIQIFLAKLELAEYIIVNKSKVTSSIVSTIVAYCKSLRLCLTENTNKKYEYLFINVSDICTRIILEMSSVTNARYLSEHISDILNFIPDKIVNLDKFVIKMIKKTNYQAVVAEDVNSGEESDVDIYGEDDSPEEETGFEITNDDLQVESADELDFVKGNVKYVDV